jgi:hypothetical protein
MTPDALAMLRAGIAPFQKQIFQAARKEKRFESQDAYNLDALIAMALASSTGAGTAGIPGPESPTDPGSTTGPDGADPNSPAGPAGPDGTPGEPTSPKTKKRSRGYQPVVRINVDLAALFRGFTQPGETCKIPGIDGAIPVSLVRELLGEAILELVIKEGQDVRAVCTNSRHISKALQIALEERDPTCQVPGCHVSEPLERDHWRVDFAKNGPTELENLIRICKYHHAQKTYGGWKIDGGPGQWRWIGPDDKSQPDVAAKAPKKSAKSADETRARSPGKNARPNASNKRVARRKAKDPPGQGELL